MMNLFITYQCNFNCDYCFIHGFSKKYPLMMQKKEFAALCDWLEENNVYTIGVLGGEPTVHPDILWMLDCLIDHGVAPVVFTNALFPHEMAEPLAERVINFVVNYNDPSMYTDAQWEHINTNIALIKQYEGSVSFSKNFSKGKIRYDYLIEGALKHGVERIRYDISRPNRLEANNYFNLDETQLMSKNIVNFVRECETKGIKTGLDCCIPLCFFSQEDAEYLKGASMKFSGICHPSIDIQTDFSATYCIPMEDVKIKNILEYKGERGLMYEFSQRVQQLRGKKVMNGCQTCSKFAKECQGGCLALKGACL